MADLSGLTIFHRDVFTRVQGDGSHEVLLLAASMTAPD